MGARLFSKTFSANLLQVNESILQTCSTKFISPGLFATLGVDGRRRPLRISLLARMLLARSENKKDNFLINFFGVRITFFLADLTDGEAGGVFLTPVGGGCVCSPMAFPPPPLLGGGVGKDIG